MGKRGNPKWNRRSLLLACEEILSRSDTSIKLQPIHVKGVTARTSFTFDESRVSRVLIIIDPSQSGQIEAALHEALHVILVNQIRGRFHVSLEETVVKALEVELWKRAFRPKDIARWRGILGRKLGGNG
jgi:hypothetical protein